MRQRLSGIVSFDPRIAEVVGLIHDNDVGKLFNPAEPIRVFAPAQQVRVVVYRQVAVLAEELGQILPQLALPNRLARSLRDKDRATRSTR